MMPRFVIVCNEAFFDKPAYWTTRMEETDNYSSDIRDATVFRGRCFAQALIDTLGLSADHYVAEVHDI